MEKRSSRYREIIVDDCLNPSYPKHKQWVWGLFAVLALAFVLIALAFYMSGLIGFVRVASTLHGLATSPDNAGLKTLVYVYEILLLFVVFLGTASVLGVFALMAYDMQQRNEVIRDLLAKSGEVPSATPPSEV